MNENLNNSFTVKMIYIDPSLMIIIIPNDSIVSTSGGNGNNDGEGNLNNWGI